MPEQGAGALLICLLSGGHTTAVAEYPDNVEPNKQISKAPAPFSLRILSDSVGKHRVLTGSSEKYPTLDGVREVKSTPARSALSTSASERLWTVSS